MSEVKQEAASQQITINIGNQKSMVVAILLAFFFGPLGLLYASVFGGLVMLAIHFGIFIVSILTLGIGSVLFLPAWFVCIIWAVVAVKGNEKQVISLVQKGNFKEAGSVVVESSK